MKKLILIPALFLLAFSGCKCPEPATVYRTDSVFVEKTYRDTVFEIESDSTMLELFLECDSANNVLITEISHSKEGKPKIEYRYVLREKKLYIKAKIDKERFKATIIDTIYKQFKERFVIQKEITNELTFIQKILFYLGLISLLGIVIFIVIYALKK